MATGQREHGKRFGKEHRYSSHQSGSEEPRENASKSLKSRLPAKLPADEARQSRDHAKVVGSKARCSRSVIHHRKRRPASALKEPSTSLISSQPTRFSVKKSASIK